MNVGNLRTPQALAVGVCQWFLRHCHTRFPDDSTCMRQEIHGVLKAAAIDVIELVENKTRVT